jgi:F-type H+-transporting ATPase subunit c
MVEFVRVCSVLGAGIAMGMGSIGSSVGAGIIAMKSVESLGRQPRASRKILPIMLISMAITETAAIFALVISTHR